jgi:1-acyl-sn-glycerol-3-phosphate acyltransferase
LILLRLVGVRPVLRGEPIDPRVQATGIVSGGKGRVLLANHVSWLDVYAINAVAPSRFVAKAEIARWPIIGWLVALVGTLFVERGRRHAVAGINRVVGEHLGRGETIGVFPEGTTTDGSCLLAFHANLVQPAIDLGAEIRPVALRYLQDGRATRAAAYVGDETLVGSLGRILLTPGLAVEVHWLEPIPAGLGTRQAIGRAARERIATALGLAADAGLRAPAGAAAELNPGPDRPDTAPAIPGGPAN